MSKSPLSNEQIAELLKHYAREYDNDELPVKSRRTLPSWLLREIAERLT